MAFDTDDLCDWIGKHKIPLLIIGCLAFAGFQLATGGLDQIDRKLALDTKLSQTADGQSRAEAIFQSQGCASQVLSRRTKTNNLPPGDVVIDPASLTPANPEGVPFSGGFVCSTDGSVFSVDQSGVITLVGTSPAIRNQLVTQGFAVHTREMKDAARRLFP